MKKIIFLFIMIIIFCPSVYAASQNISSKVEAIPNFGGGTYYATQPVSVPVPLYQNIGTRYNGTLSKIEFYLDNTKWNWNYNSTYTITLNMSTEDWRNNFMGPIVVQTNSNGTTQSSSCSKYVSNTFRFVSYKTIKFNFKLCSTMGSYTKFTVYSTNTTNTAITGISNYNLSNITISDTATAPTPTPVGPTPTPTPTSQANNQDIINNANQNTQDIIDSNNQNTQDIINNNTENTSDIIENNNQNTEDIINNQNELLGNCYSNLSSVNDLTVAFSPGNSGSSYLGEYENNFKKYYFSYHSSYNTSRILIMPYNSDNTVITTTPFTSSVNFIYNSSYGGYYYNGGVNTSFNILFNSSVFKFRVYFIALQDPVHVYENIMLSNSNMPFISAGTEKCDSKLNETTDAINNLNDSINNGNIDDKTGFFTNFQDNSHGLTGIITAPLSTIQSLANTSCSPLSIPIPFTNSNVNLPCMTEVYEDYVPTVFNLWQIVSFGIISYFIYIDIFKMVKGFKDPNEDKVEVLDL